MKRSSDPELDVRAMEAALGHRAPELAPVDAARVEELLDAEAYWNDRLSPLLDTVEPVAPSSALWQRIAAETVAPKVARAAARRAAADRRRPLAARLWTFLGLGPLSAFAAAAASLVIVALANTPQPALVAILQSPDGARPGFVVEIAADGTALRLVPLVSPDVPAGRALEFWTKADADAGPTSLGLVATDAPAALTFPNAEPGPGQLFEVTLEPATGSPIGRPTGPILFIGRAIRGDTI